MAEKANSNGKQKAQGETTQTQEKQTLPLAFEVRIHSIQPNEVVKGSASININGAFAIRGVKIIEGSKDG